MSGKHDDDETLVEEIYDALDAGEPQRALAAARMALHEAPDDPVLRYLAGIALLEMEHLQDADRELTRALDLDPDDPEFRTARAQARFALCRFDEAKTDAARALEADASIADARVVLGLVAEREGRLDVADAAFAEAAAADPERFVRPVRLSRAAFDGIVLRAGAMLPEEFRERLAEVAVLVDDLPATEVLLGEGEPLDPELLGLFVGTALPERSFASSGLESPPRIFLFQRNLERFAADEGELRREIARTLHHELAHYLGFAEEEMAELDLD
ncbi:MAG TPA: metallopeptidase family protein [Candidatus Polarisedimenticolaceae bacterium]|nr:metallopeptidase family protein [Candidatus Polarisedimenticolaceae bacterium]